MFDRGKPNQARSLQFGSGDNPLQAGSREAGDTLLWVRTREDLEPALEEVSNLYLFFGAYRPALVRANELRCVLVGSHPPRVEGSSSAEADAGFGITGVWSLHQLGEKFLSARGLCDQLIAAPRQESALFIPVFRSDHPLTEVNDEMRRLRELSDLRIAAPVFQEVGSGRLLTQLCTV